MEALLLVAEHDGRVVRIRRISHHRIEFPAPVIVEIDAVPHSMEAVDVPQAAQRCYIAGAMSQRCSRG
jgi:hypothetical protein